MGVAHVFLSLVDGWVEEEGGVGSNFGPEGSGGGTSNDDGEGSRLVLIAVVMVIALSLRVIIVVLIIITVVAIKCDQYNTFQLIYLTSLSFPSLYLCPDYKFTLTGKVMQVTWWRVLRVQGNAHAAISVIFGLVSFSS